MLTAAERAIADAAVAGLSTSSRLDLAYRAIMQVAQVAMLANGFRPSTGESGHHQVLIQALPKTLGIPVERVRVLEAFRVARNRIDYDGALASDAMAQECIVESRRLLGDARAWLTGNRPDLLGISASQ